MEVSSVMSCSQTKIGKFDFELRELGFNKQILSKKNHVCFDLMKRNRRAAIQVSPRAVHVEVSRLEKKALIQRSKSVIFGGDDLLIMEVVSAKNLVHFGELLENPLKEGVVELFVGLPLDGISDCNTLVHARAIEAGLRALKLLGVEGVEIPVWWGIVEKEAMGKYNWSGYIALAKMVQDAGLKLRVSLCFHASKEPAIPLPQWVSQIGDSQPDIFFSDRSGKRFKDCLSFAVDELPVLDGRSPLQVYQGFLESFKSSFSAFMESTITDISIGLGPNGELRYPSDPPTRANQVPSAGEFQCYDRHMLNHLKQQAEATGNHYWGLTGPHDAPTYNQLPNSNTFFKENGGSWGTPYGHFFLSWYSNQLMSHGDRLLSLASATFNSSSITISGKIPLVHSWYSMQSHPSEMTAGFYNTNSRNGYDSIVEMFARNSCKMILPGMDLSDKHQPQGSLSSPELLLSQIKIACEKHGVQVSGENSQSLGTPNGYDQIKQNLSTGNALVDSFTYQRMGAYFFSPKHFPLFSEFVINLNEPELHPDDIPTYEKVEARDVSEAVNDRQMQEA